jgi:hypothetical protein
LNFTLTPQHHFCVFAMVDITADPRFAGLLQAIDPVGDFRPDRGQILDDIEGEQETVPEDGLNK